MEEQTTKIKKKSEEVVAHLGFDGEAIITKRDSVFHVNLQIDDPTLLIGKNGETLDALQHILRLLIGQEVFPDTYLVIDINGYRKKKSSNIEKRAREIANRVRELEQEIEMEPMNSYERRLIHTLITNIADVESESRGYGRERKVVIKPKKK